MSAVIVPFSRARLRDALLRQELECFIAKCFKTVWPGTKYLPNWHIQAIAYQLRVKNGEIDRLLITQPPRSLKSLSVSVAYVAWRLGHDPTLRVLVVSYSSEYAAELHRQFRMVIHAPWYRALFPAWRPDKDTSTELVTTKGGDRFASSVDGSVTGRGGDLVIIDDPLKAEEASSESARSHLNEWYEGTLLTRLNDKGQSPIIMVAQRLHELDLPGYVLERGGWEHLNLPAIAIEDAVIPISRDQTITRRAGDALHPQREGQQVLDRIRTEMGSTKFSAQYQQAPVPAGGHFIQRQWFRWYDQIPAGPGDYIVQSWDVAMCIGENNDYSVCTTWHVHRDQSDYYLLDVFRSRLPYPTLRSAMGDLATCYRPRYVLIENVGPGMAILQELRHRPPRDMPRPIAITPTGSKRERMAAEAAKIEAGHVHLPKNASWLTDFLHEHLAFPYGRHDDQVDSVSQFLNWIAKRRDRDGPFVIGAPMVF